MMGGCILTVMHECNDFAIKTGFATPNVRKLIRLAEDGGAIGAAQNMVGEAVHALVPLDQLETVVESFKTVLPSDNILVASIDLQGARILNELRRPEPI
jgi:pantoate kinase